MKKNLYNFSLSKTNHQKVFKTLRGSIKKGIFYLGIKIPYQVTEELFYIPEKKNLKSRLGKIYSLFILDAKIRYCDDLLDNTLAKKNPRPVKKMKEVISEFERDIGNNSGDVPRLFKGELDLIENARQYKKDELKIKIRELIEIRPCDYFLLIENLYDLFGTELEKNDYNISLAFYMEFQKLRDLLDDIMSIEEDIINRDYNHIVVARDNGIQWSFFDKIVKEKFNMLEKYKKKIKNHPNKNIFKQTIDFWKVEYEKLFKVLLLDFYKDLKKFRKSYFLIKQL